MRIIDADGHVLERDIPWADLLEAPYRDRAPKAVKDNRGFTFVMMEGKLTPKPVEIAHQEDFQGIGIFLHERARDTGAGADNLQTALEEIDDHRIAFALGHFSLRRRDD